MTFQEFIEKYNGQYVEVAGSANAKNQCVDLANAYIRDVLGLPIIEWTNAIDFPSKAGDKYAYILNAPTNIPLEGDIVIWGKSPGHIAIFIEGNVDSFRSFDQNYPIGSPCHVQNHTYSNVLGWLRCKEANGNSLQLLETCKAQVADEIKKKNETYIWGKELEFELEGAKAQIQSYQDYVKVLGIMLMMPDADQNQILGQVKANLESMMSKEDELRQCRTTVETEKQTATAKEQERLEWEKAAKECATEKESLSLSLHEVTEKKDELERKVHALESSATGIFVKLPFINLYYKRTVK